jgi:hypothetical protein
MGQLALRAGKTEKNPLTDRRQQNYEPGGCDDDEPPHRSDPGPAFGALNESVRVHREILDHNCTRMP